MSRIGRLAVFWLLSFALPLQGVAAATMMACAPVGHHGNAGHAAGHGHGQTASDVHASAPGAATATHSAHAEHAAHAAAGPADDADALSGGGAAAKCSACSSCCTGAAVPARLLVLGTVELPEFYAPLATRSVAAFVTEGPERPPRPPLA